jgi:hypothetical protein
MGDPNGASEELRSGIPRNGDKEMGLRTDLLEYLNDAGTEGKHYRADQDRAGLWGVLMRYEHECTRVVEGDTTLVTLMAKDSTDTFFLEFDLRRTDRPSEIDRPDFILLESDAPGEHYVRRYFEGESVEHYMSRGSAIKLYGHAVTDAAFVDR